MARPPRPQRQSYIDYDSETLRLGNTTLNSAEIKSGYQFKSRRSSLHTRNTSIPTQQSTLRDPLQEIVLRRQESSQFVSDTELVSLAVKSKQSLLSKRNNILNSNGEFDMTKEFCNPRSQKASQALLGHYINRQVKHLSTLGYVPLKRKLFQPQQEGSSTNFLLRNYVKQTKKYIDREYDSVQRNRTLDLPKKESSAVRIMKRNIKASRKDLLKEISGEKLTLIAQPYRMRNTKMQTSFDTLINISF